MNVKAVVKAVQNWTPEEWALAAQLRKLGGQSASPKPRRKYTRKAKPVTEKPERKAKAGNGQTEGLAYPKPAAKRRGRPPKVRAMVPPVETASEA